MLSCGWNIPIILSKAQGVFLEEGVGKMQELEQIGQLCVECWCLGMM